MFLTCRVESDSIANANGTLFICSDRFRLVSLCNDRTRIVLGYIGYIQHKHSCTSWLNVQLDLGLLQKGEKGDATLYSHPSPASVVPVADTVTLALSVSPAY